MDYRLLNWEVDFQNYIVNLSSKKNVILSGDLNVAHKELDIYDPKRDHFKRTAGFTNQERECFTKFLEKGFIDTYRHLNPDKVIIIDI